jgi:hypothetical protein
MIVSVLSWSEAQLKQWTAGIYGLLRPSVTSVFKVQTLHDFRNPRYGSIKSYRLYISLRIQLQERRVLMEQASDMSLTGLYSNSKYSDQPLRTTAVQIHLLVASSHQNISPSQKIPTTMQEVIQQHLSLCACMHHHRENRTKFLPPSTKFIKPTPL